MCFDSLPSFNDDPFCLCLCGSFLCCAGLVAFSIFAGVTAGIAALIAHATGNDLLPTILIVLSVEAGLAMLFLCLACFNHDGPGPRLMRKLCNLCRRRQSQPEKIAVPALPVRQTFRLISLSKDATNSWVLGTALSGKQLFRIAAFPTEVQSCVLRDAIAKPLKESPQNLKLFENDRTLTDMEVIKDVALITVQQTSRVNQSGHKQSGQGEAPVPKTLLGQSLGSNKEIPPTCTHAPTSQKMTPASFIADLKEDPMEDVV